ncbi:hypothetical protein TNCV_3995651 [Trichonephila clavipes]|nr:hypothetical protein TNCV_3995651 [Trichonephila clavipes]
MSKGVATAVLAASMITCPPSYRGSKIVNTKTSEDVINSFINRALSHAYKIARITYCLQKVPLFSRLETLKSRYRFAQNNEKTRRVVQTRRKESTNFFVKAASQEDRLK